MADDTAELLVSIRADIQDLKDKFDEAQTAGEGFTGAIGDAFGDLGRMIGEVFAAEKIKDFFEAGITNFAAFDEQLTLTQDNLERVGQATGDTREEMENWAKTIQATTLFTKDEALGTLNKLVTMTQDLGASLKLSKLAMDISTASGVGLQQVTLALGNAFEGNLSGLGRFTRAFPDLKRVMEEGKDPVAWLQAHFDGMAKQLGQAGLAGELFHAKVAFQELGEEMAKQNETSIQGALGGILEATKALSSFIFWTIKASQTVGLEFGTMAVMASHFGELFGNIFHEGPKKALLDFRTAMTQAKVDFQQASDEVWKPIGEETGKTFAKAQVEGILKSKPDMAKVVQTLGELQIEAAGKVFDTLIELSGSKNQALVTIAKAADIAKAIMNTAVAATEAMATVPPPYGEIEAAAIDVQGGIQIAKIAGVELATGGIVTAPTRALIGEAGPEAVIPLSGGAAASYGLGGGDNHFHFPGVTNRHEAAAAGQSAGLAFAKTQNAMRVRAGTRNSRT